MYTVVQENEFVTSSGLCLLHLPKNRAEYRVTTKVCELGKQYFESIHKRQHRFQRPHVWSTTKFRRTPTSQKKVRFGVRSISIYTHKNLEHINMKPIQTSRTHQCLIDMKPWFLSNKHTHKLKKLASPGPLLPNRKKISVRAAKPKKMTIQTHRQIKSPCLIFRFF